MELLFQYRIHLSLSLLEGRKKVRNNDNRFVLSIAIIIGIFIFLRTGLAADPPKPAGNEEVNVEAIRKKYWAKGRRSRLGVVQNRLYSKAGRFSLGVTGGVAFSDPFLTTRTVGGNIGYYFNEFFGIHLIGWKDFVSASSALETFEESRGATANTNEPNYFAGTEASVSMIYGKLSLLGAKIIYYDLHGLIGGGVTDTESGLYATPHIGLGQRFFLSKLFSLRIDYRLQFYRETILEKEIPTKLGQPQGQRDNWQNNIQLGVDFFFGGK